MQHPHAAQTLSAAELAWLHTLVGYAEHAAHAVHAEHAEPALSKAERHLRRKASNRTSASAARERRNAHVRALEAAVRELERENADLLALLQRETALNVLLKAAASSALMPER